MTDTTWARIANHEDKYSNFVFRLISNSVTGREQSEMSELLQKMSGCKVVFVTIVRKAQRDALASKTSSLLAHFNRHLHVSSICDPQSKAPQDIEHRHSLT